MKTTKSNRSSSFLALALAAAGFAAAASGCGLSVEAEIPEVTITQRDLMFQGVPDFGIGDVSVEKTYSQDHGKIEMPEGLESEIKTLGVTLRATSGVSDMSFLKLLRVTMSSANVAEPVELGSYEYDPNAPKSTEINLTALNPLNVFDAWNADKATFTLQLAGSLPTTNWTADVIVRFSARAKYEY
jgi:hypothetical protein